MLLAVSGCAQMAGVRLASDPPNRIIVPVVRCHFQGGYDGVYWPRFWCDEPISWGDGK